MAETKVKTEKKVATSPTKASAAKTTAKPKSTSEKKPAATKKTSTAKTTTKTTAKKSKANTTALEQRYKMIEVAAYYIAEKDGFAGNPVDYWIAAEAQISNTDQ